jgi:hypothetical protein
MKRLTEIEILWTDEDGGRRSYSTFKRDEAPTLVGLPPSWDDEDDEAVTAELAAALNVIAGKIQR